MKFGLEIDERFCTTLEKLKTDMGLGSKADVVRFAVALLNRAIKADKKGEFTIIGQKVVIFP